MKVGKGIIVGANIQMTAIRENQELHSPFVEGMLAEIRKALESIPGVKVTAIDSDMDDKELEECYRENTTQKDYIKEYGSNIHPALHFGIKNISQASSGLGPDCARITNALLMVLGVDRAYYVPDFLALIKGRTVISILHDFFSHLQYVIAGKGMRRSGWWKENADKQCHEIFGCGYKEILGILGKDGF